MTPDPKKLLTSGLASDSTEPVRGQPDMAEAGKREWHKRYSWAKCREPDKTQLDTLGSLWVEGELSNEGLALEVVQLLSDLEDWGNPKPDSSPYRQEDVIAQVKVLTQAMLAVSEYPSAQQNSQMRRQALDFVQANLGPETGAAR